MIEQQKKPSFTWGLINPSVEREDPRKLGFEPLLPSSIEILNTPLGLRQYTAEGVNEAIVRYDDCVRDLVGRGAQMVSLTGVPVSVQLGRKRVHDLMRHTELDLGVRGDAAAEAVVDAMKHLNVRRVAVGSRWAEQVNQKLVRYFGEAGIEVLAITDRGQWLDAAHAMSFEMGVRVSLELAREVMPRAPKAEGLFLPGGAWRPLAVVPALEEDYGIPVFTNDTTRAWRFIHEGIAPPIEGWGKLLATP